MINIQLQATQEQAQLIQEYINNKELNLIENIIEIIEDYRDTQEALESIKNTTSTYSLQEICKKNGINYEAL